MDKTRKRITTGKARGRGWISAAARSLALMQPLKIAALSLGEPLCGLEIQSTHYYRLLLLVRAAPGILLIYDARGHLDSGAILPRTKKEALELGRVLDRFMQMASSSFSSWAYHWCIKHASQSPMPMQFPVPWIQTTDIESCRVQGSCPIVKWLAATVLQALQHFQGLVRLSRRSRAELAAYDGPLPWGRPSGPLALPSCPWPLNVCAPRLQFSMPQRLPFMVAGEMGDQQHLIPNPALWELPPGSQPSLSLPQKRISHPPSLIYSLL